jgi:hypothetical protein
MEKQIEMYDGDAIATYTETDEKKQKVWDEIIKFCKKYNVNSGESFQSDDPQIYAADCIANIVENIIEFDLKFKD